MYSQIVVLLLQYVLALPAPPAYNPPNAKDKLAPDVQHVVCPRGSDDCCQNVLFPDWTAKFKAAGKTAPVVSYMADTTGALRKPNEYMFFCYDRQQTLPAGEVRIRGLYDATCPAGQVVATLPSSTEFGKAVLNENFGRAQCQKVDHQHVHDVLLNTKRCQIVIVAASPGSTGSLVTVYTTYKGDNNRLMQSVLSLYHPLPAATDVGNTGDLFGASIVDPRVAYSVSSFVAKGDVMVCASLRSDAVPQGFSPAADATMHIFVGPPA